MDPMYNFKLNSKNFHGNESVFNPHHNPLPGSSPTIFNNSLGTCYNLCPKCGRSPIKVNKNSSLTCKGGHYFYQCPTCFDTRVSDHRDEVYYCGQMHPYHVCPLHRIPVPGIYRMSQNCTCPRVKELKHRSDSLFTSSPFKSTKSSTIKSTINYTTNFKYKNNDNFNKPYSINTNIYPKNWETPFT